MFFRRPLMVLLGMGVIFGYGGAFASFRHHAAECHRWEQGERWGGGRFGPPWSRQEQPPQQAPTPTVAPAPQVAPIIVQAPAAPVSPVVTPQVFIVMPGATQAQPMPAMVMPATANVAPAPAAP